MASWLPWGVYGGGLAQCMDIGTVSPSTGKLYIGSDTQGFYFDPGSATLGNTLSSRNVGLGASANYNQIACILSSVQFPGTTYMGTGDGLVKSTDDGLHWTAVNSTDVIWAANGASSADPIPSLNQARPVGRLLIEDTAGAIKYLWAGTYKKGIKRSADQGATWPTTANMGSSAPGSNYYCRALAQDPDQATTLYAGFIEHNDTGGSRGFGGIWRCTNAHTTTTTPNFAKLTGLAVAAAEDIKVLDGLIYVACGTDGVYMADKTADLTNAANWINIGTLGGTGLGPVLNAASIWMSVDVVNDGSGHHLIAAACSSAADTAKTDVAMMTVTVATKTLTARVSLANNTNVSTATVPPGGQTWWNAGSGLTMGHAGFVNPQVMWDPNDGTHQKMYVSGAQGFYRSTNQGSTWAWASGGARMFLGRATAVDPNFAGYLGVCSSDWLVLWANDGVAANASTTSQGGSGLPGSTQGYAIAVDPVDSTWYLGVGPKYLNPPNGGAVYQGAGGGTFPPGPFTLVSGTPTWATATGSGGLCPIGLCALRDGSNNKVLLAAAYNGGLWRNVQASGVWTGWTQVGTSITGLMGTTGNVGFNVPFSIGPGGVGNPPIIYFWDQKGAGIVRSADYGVTWTLVLAVNASSAGSASLAAHPVNVGELWYTTGYNLHKLTHADGSGSLVNNLIGTLSAGALAIRASDGLLVATTKDSGSGQAAWQSADSGGTWAALGGAEFGQLDNTTEFLTWDSNSTRLFASGSNVAEYIGSAAGTSGAFTQQQSPSNNLTGAAGTLNAWFSATSVASTAGTMLVFRVSMDDSAMTTAMPAGWELAFDSPSGTTAGQVRVQEWVYRSNPGSLYGSVGTAAAFTYSNTSANVRGKLHEWATPASTFQYLDRTATSGALAASTSLGPETIAALRVTGGLAQSMTGVLYSAVPTNSWPAVSGWTTDGSLANAVMSWSAKEDNGLAAGTLTLTDTVSTATNMTSWASGFATYWASLVHITTASLPGGNVGAAYSQAITSAGGTGPYTLSLWSGTLPTGLTLTGGNLAGTPSAAGSFTFTVLATDSTGAMGYRQFTVTIAVGVAITTPSTLPDGAVGDPYSLTMTLSGGASPFTWTQPSGTLPTGLTLSSGGVLSGTPSADGAFSFDVMVTDHNGSTDRTTLTVTIQPQVAVTTNALPPGVVTVSYATALGQSGGLPDYTWAITSGSLPAGLALDAASGIIAGTPTTAGTAPFTVQVTDGGGSTASMALVIVVTNPPTPAAATDSLVLAGQFELLAGGVVSDHPACPGAVFRLGRAGGALDYDLGMPQPVQDLVASLALDGERPKGRRASNRTMVVPVVIQVPITGDQVADRSLLAAAREALWQAIDGDRWELTWARGGGLPVVFDCFRAGATTYEYSLLRDKSLISTMDITFQALPYGRSTDLETIAFAAPSAQWQQPADPVTIDNFATVSSQNDPGQWSQSTQAAAGAFSAHWSRRWRDRPHYTHVLATPVQIGTRPKVSFWVGLGTSADQFHVWHGGRVTCDIQLTDSSGTTVQMAATVKCACSGLPNQPFWTRVSAAMPLTTDFDVTAVASYSIKAWNTTDSGDGSRVLQAEFYLAGLEASSTAVGSPQARGAAYLLRGVVGTARAPLSLQLQPAPATVQQVFQRDNPGAGTWPVPAGVTTIKGETWASGSGGGGGDGGSLGGGGGPGGEYSCEPAMPVSPGSNVLTNVGAPGNGGAVHSAGHAGAVSSITTPAGMTVQSNPGPGGLVGGSHSSVGAAGGTGSHATVHFDGGDGGPPEPGNRSRSNGAGGGGSGGQFQGGRDGQVAGDKSPGSGGVQVGGGGPGGTGGTQGGAGQPPSQGPGGGGGGGDAQSPGGAGASGRVRITYGVTAGIPLQSLIVHRAGPSAPGTLQPLVSVNASGTDVPDGTTEYPVLSYAPGVQPAFNGTYTVVAVANTFASAGSSRTLTVQIKQYDGASGNPPTSGVGRVSVNSVARTFTPNTDAPNGLIVLGDVTLPVRGLAADQADATYTLTVTDDNHSDVWYDVLLLDTEGSTVLLNGTAQGYANVFIDAPDADQAAGWVLGSYYDRDAASAIMDDTVISGPPLSVDPGDNWLFAYSRTGAPAMFATYLPRWWLDRLR